MFLTFSYALKVLELKRNRLKKLSQLVVYFVLVKAIAILCRLAVANKFHVTEHAGSSINVSICSIARVISYEFLVYGERGFLGLLYIHVTQYRNERNTIFFSLFFVVKKYSVRSHTQSLISLIGSVSTSVKITNVV